MNPPSEKINWFHKARYGMFVHCGAYSVADWSHPDYPDAYARDWPTSWPDLLLNVGPRADGSIPEESTKILLAAREWPN